MPAVICKYGKTPFSALLCAKAANRRSRRGVAIGRGALGDPSLLYRVEKYINCGEYIAPPTLEEKIATLKKHLNKEVEFRGEDIGVKFCRKFYPYYVNGFQGASRLRGELVLMNDLKEIFKKLDGILAVKF